MTKQHATASNFSNSMEILVENAQIPTKPFIYKLVAMQQIGDNFFVMQGLARGKSSWSRNQRNMVIIRHRAELTLVNPIQLRPEDEASLIQLGKIKRIIRLGPSLRGGAKADQYYQSVFRAQLYVPRSASYSLGHDGDKDEGKAETQVIHGSTHLPIPKTRFFLFSNTVKPEAALLVDDVLITSECMQDQQDNVFVSPPARAVMRLRGYLEYPVVIKPRWRKQMEGRQSLHEDFKRLVRHDFSMLVGASGAIISSCAKEKAVTAVDRAFSSNAGPAVSPDWSVELIV